MTDTEHSDLSELLPIWKTVICSPSCQGCLSSLLMVMKRRKACQGSDFMKQHIDLTTHLDRL